VVQVVNCVCGIGAGRAEVEVKQRFKGKVVGRGFECSVCACCEEQRPGPWTAMFGKLTMLGRYVALFVTPSLHEFAKPCFIHRWQGLSSHLCLRPRRGIEGESVVIPTPRLTRVSQQRYVRQAGAKILVACFGFAVARYQGFMVWWLW
jgi:hypothetical protein